jgi:hypothetical protein
MADPRYLESLDPMPAEVGKWVYGKSLAPLLDGRIPVAAPGGLASLGVDGKLDPAQRGNDGQFVPTFIPDGQTFVIPANTQALFVLPITLGDGATLVVEGNLLEIAA